MLWNSVGNLIYLAAQWLYTYIVIWLMGFDSAGLFSLAMSIATIFSGIATYSMRNYQVSDLANAFSQRDYILSRIITSLSSLLLCLLFVGFSDYGAYTAACIASFALFKGAEALSDVYQGILQRAMRMDYIGKAYLIKSLAGLMLFTGALLLFKDLLTALAVLGTATLLVVLLYERHTAFMVSPNNSSRKATNGVLRLLIACLPVAICGFLTNATGQIPKTILEAATNTEALGYYTSIAMPLMLVQISANYFFTPLITPLAQSYSEKNQSTFFSIVKKVLFAITVFAFAAFALFNAFGEQLMTMLYGEDIIPYMYLMNPLIASSLMVALFWFLNAILVILRSMKTLVVLSLISFFTVFFGSFPFISFFGINGATFIYIAALCLFILGSVASIAITTKRMFG